MRNPEDPRNRRLLFDNHLMRVLNNVETVYRQSQFMEHYKDILHTDKTSEGIDIFLAAFKTSIHNIFHEVCLIKERLLVLHNEIQDPLNPPVEPEIENDYYND